MFFLNVLNSFILFLVYCCNLFPSTERYPPFSSCSNKKHTENIMNLPTLKEAHIYCKFNNMSGQFTGPVLEKYIEKKQ